MRIKNGVFNEIYHKIPLKKNKKTASKDSLTDVKIKNLLICYIINPA